MTDDPFRVALEAALAAKKPIVTNEQRAQAIKMLITQATNDSDARNRLVEVARILAKAVNCAESPENVADEWITAAREARDKADKPLSNRESDNGPLIGQEPPPVRVVTMAMGTGQTADDAKSERATARARAKLEAQKLQDRQQAKYQDPLSRGLGWLRGR